MFNNNNQQKSPQRRFLLILGVVAAIAFSSLGLMIIFWDAMLPTLPRLQKTIIGIAIIIYAIIRFARLLKREKDEE